MRALVQRVSEASVTVAGERISAIDEGILILICAMEGDEDAASEKLAQKISKLRVFKDDEGRMNKSLVDIGGAALIVSQFTLAADTSRGNRPGFSAAANPEEGARLYQKFCDDMRALDIRVETGQFGADMDVALVNQGPVTIWMEI